MTTPDFTFPDALRVAVQDHPYPLLFATLSGAHLYGFPSPDSDWDLRGAHLLPLREVLGLQHPRDTVEVMYDPARHAVDLDLVTHDAAKFFRLLLKRNGYVLEQLHSPLVVHTTPAHAELRRLAAGVVTRYHAHHYLGFSASQWQMFQKEPVRRVKPLLYTFRTLLTGLHLMRTGETEANLDHLNAEAKLDYLDDLMHLKRTGAEKEPFTGDLAFCEREYHRLTRELEDAHNCSTLPKNVDQRTVDALNDLLVNLRLKGQG